MTQAPQPRRTRGRPPGPPKPPKVRKRKPTSETKVGRARAAALATVSDEEIGIEKGGRPTKFRDEFVRIAKAMCRLGATDADLAEEFCVDISQIWHWQAKHPRFAKALAVGKGPADERVVRSFYQRAVGYTYGSEKIFNHQGTIVRAKTAEHVPPDPGAAFNWLTNRRPDEWKSRSQLEHSGRDGRSLGQELGIDSEAVLIRTARWVADLLSRANEAPTEAISALKVLSPPAGTSP